MATFHRGRILIDDVSFRGKGAAWLWWQKRAVSGAEYKLPSAAGDSLTCDGHHPPRRPVSMRRRGAPPTAGERSTLSAHRDTRPIPASMSRRREELHRIELILKSKSLP